MSKTLLIPIAVVSLLGFAAYESDGIVKDDAPVDITDDENIAMMDTIWTEASKVVCPGYNDLVNTSIDVAAADDFFIDQFEAGHSGTASPALRSHLRYLLRSC